MPTNSSSSLANLGKPQAWGTLESTPAHHLCWPGSQVERGPNRICTCLSTVTSFMCTHFSKFRRSKAASRQQAPHCALGSLPPTWQLKESAASPGLCPGVQPSPTAPWAAPRAGSAPPPRPGLCGLRTCQEARPAPNPLPVPADSSWHAGLAGPSGPRGPVAGHPPNTPRAGTSAPP